MEIVGMYKVYHEVLEPAFLKKGWSLKDIYKNRTSVASIQADCLSWNVYSDEEKLQLKEAIYRLSSSYKVKRAVWMYLNGYGKYLDFYSKISFKLKSYLKQIIIKIRY
ncbi:MAG: hypothetical protein EOP43_02460 [Sphingobacteriaceae bacterium]|nr:MAG: hypothetical protein EOP43_02460 [Sphingobacteriaceae bacterium]